MAVDGDNNDEAGPETSIVDVCIVSFNSAPVLADTIVSIADHVPGAVIAIREHGSDSGANDALRKFVADADQPIRLEFDPTNPGFGSGCNALARGGSAPWILFLNPDAQILSWPWNAHRPPPSEAITGPFMAGEGETERQSGVSYRIIDEVKRSWLRRTGPRPNGRGFVSGAALLIDRASFECVGGFDERYFMFYEDIDFCLRANELGVRTVSEPSWVVRHIGAHSTKERFGESLDWSYEAACRFHDDRGESLWRYRTFVFLDSALRSILHASTHNVVARSAYLRLARRSATDLTSKRTRPVHGRSEPAG